MKTTRLNHTPQGATLNIIREGGVIPFSLYGVQSITILDQGDTLPSECVLVSSFQGVQGFKIKHHLKHFKSPEVLFLYFILTRTREGLYNRFYYISTTRGGVARG